MKRPHLRYGWETWIAAAVAFLFGLALTIHPGISFTVIVTVIGAAAIVAGIALIVHYALVGRDMPVGDIRMASGILLIAAGAGVIVFKNVLISFLPWVFGVIMFLSGVTKLQYSANMFRMTYDRWWGATVSAAVSIVLGLLIVLHPFGMGLMLVRLIGISLMVEAVQDVLSLRSYDHAVRTHFVD